MAFMSMSLYGVNCFLVIASENGEVTFSSTTHRSLLCISASSAPGISDTRHRHVAKVRRTHGDSARSCSSTVVLPSMYHFVVSPRATMWQFFVIQSTSPTDTVGLVKSNSLQHTMSPTL